MSPSDLALHSHCFKKTVLQALGINLISDIIAVSSLELLGTNLRSTCATSVFLNSKKKNQQQK